MPRQHPYGITLRLGVKGRSPREMSRPGLGNEQAKGPAGLDRRRLRRVAEQPHLRTGGPDVADQPIQPQGPCHADFGDEHDVTRVEERRSARAFVAAFDGLLLEALMTRPAPTAADLQPLTA
jgi:hypothetical protein